MLREVRAAIGPERGLRVDANMAWTADTARATLHELETLGVEYVEEPVAGIAAMAELRRSTRIPISAHSSDIPTAAALGAPDALVLGIAGCGGIGPTLRFAAACAAGRSRVSVLQRRSGHRHRRPTACRRGNRVGHRPPPDAASLVPRRRHHRRPAASTPRPTAGARSHARFGRGTRSGRASPRRRPIRVRRRVRLLRRTAAAAVLDAWAATGRSSASAETRARASIATRLPATGRRRSPSRAQRPAPVAADRRRGAPPPPKRSGWAR